MEIAGVWLVEIGEMDAVTRAGATTMKAFLTRRFDRFRPPWARHLVRLQRQCVFAGSINPPPGGYLKDVTGARRFWPFVCRGMIDRDGVIRDRDQLWAEAVARYKAGAKWWLETPELEALASAEQEARFKSDVWKPKIKEWLGGRTNVSLTEVLRGALEITAPDHAAEIRVAKILTSLGFRQYRPRRGQRSRRYRRH
jgi:predicted P-loop ATPase